MPGITAFKRIVILVSFTAMPFEGQVLAEAEVFKCVDQSRGILGALTHTAALVEKQVVRLVKLPGAQFQLHVLVPGPVDVELHSLQLDADWDILPKEVTQISRQVFTLKAPGESRADVALNGEFYGEDIPLYAFELKRKSHLLERLFNPNTALPELDHPPEEPKSMRLAFEEQQDAMEWYALVALCCGSMKEDDPSLDQLPMARAHSKGLLDDSAETADN